MKLLRLIGILILTIGITFVQLIKPNEAIGEQNKCSYTNVFGTRSRDLLEIISKYCGEQNWYATTWVFEKLNINTGGYDTIGVLHKAPKYYPEAVSFPANIAILDNNEPGLSFNVVSLSTMKIVGKITVDVQSTEDICQLLGETSPLISPDGSRIAVPYISDEKNCTQAIGIFDGKTYKSIATLYNMSLGKFPSDGELLYTYSKTMGITEYMYLINPSDGKVLKTIPLEGIDKGEAMVSKIIGDVKDDLMLISEQKKNSAGTVTSTIFSYNINTGIVSPKIIPGSYGVSAFGDNWKYIVFDALTVSSGVIKSVGQVNVYEILTGNKVAGFNISSSTDKGAIISWPNDHTFIYNTTQQLIYFDINQNKVIKELPIIRPWEQKGWKPEVGK